MLYDKYTKPSGSFKSPQDISVVSGSSVGCPHRTTMLSTTVKAASSNMTLFRTGRHSQNSTIFTDSDIELAGHMAHNDSMRDSTPPDLSILAALLLQNERSFVVR